MRVDFKEKRLPKSKKEQMLESLIKLKEQRNEEFDILKFTNVDDQTFLRLYYEELSHLTKKKPQEVKLTKDKRNRLITEIIKFREEDGKEVNVEGLLKLSNRVLLGIYYSEIEKNKQKFIPSNQYTIEDMLNDENFQRDQEIQEAIEAYNNGEFDIPVTNRYDRNNMFDQDGFLDPNGCYDLNGRLLSDKERKEKQDNRNAGPKR